MQARVASYAEQAVAVRRAEHEADVAGTLAARTVVKTRAMRGTLHLLRPDQAAGALSPIASARTWLTSTWKRDFATAEQRDAIAEAVSSVLVGAELTRDELARAIVEHTGDPSLGEKLAEVDVWSDVLGESLTATVATVSRATAGAVPAGAPVCAGAAPRALTGAAHRGAA